MKPVVMTSIISCLIICHLPASEPANEAQQSLRLEQQREIIMTVRALREMQERNEELLRLLREASRSDISLREQMREVQILLDPLVRNENK